MIKPYLLSFALLLLFSCSKSIPGGGVKFTFKPRHSYHYSDAEALIAPSQNSYPPTKQANSPQANPIILQPVNDGTWYWRYIVQFDSSGGLNGSRSYDGNVVIKKGQVEEITLED